MVGWIKISREIANHWIWQDAERLKWWLDLLFLAAWEDKQVLHDSHLFMLRKGQLIASISFLSERWHKSNPTIIKFLQLLENEGMIYRQVLYRQTPVITICNYEKFQCNDDSTLNTQIDSIVDRQNDEKIRGKVDKPISEVNIIKSDSLGYKGEMKVDSIVDTQVDSIVYRNKEIKEYSSSTTARARENKNTEFIEQLKNNSPIWVEQMAMRFHTPTSDILRRIDEFAIDCECRGYIHRDLEDARRHYNDWLRIQLEVERKKKENETDRQRSQDKRRGTEISSTRWQDYEGEF